MNIICPFTREQSLVEDNPTNVLQTIYSNNVIGKIKIPGTLLTILQNGKYESIKSIITGLSREHFEKYHTPFEISSGLLEGGYKDFNYPNTFDKKAYYLLKVLYENGGAEYKTFSIYPSRDYPLAYANDSDEFSRILEKLDEDFYIKLINPAKAEDYELIQTDLKLTKEGINEIRKKDLPQIPMIGLIDQKVFTGDIKIDERILHAKKLFFKSNSTMDEKRSACETLSFVLERIREEMKEYLVGKDVEDFFRIVNEFDIRHNKNNTKTLKYEEQLEWVFYSLLNSIGCYFNLKKN